MVSRDRGQLILVGAIAIALILLGLVLIVNTALFTQVVGSEGTVEFTKSGGMSSEEAGQAIGTMVATENREHDSLADINDSVNRNVSTDLQSAYANRSFESSGAFVSVDYLDYTDTGIRTAQDDVGTFEADDGQDDWSPIRSSGEESTVERIFLTVHNIPSSPFEMTVTDEDGDQMVIRLSDGGGGDLDVEVAGPTGLTSCTVAPEQNTVRIHASDGHVYEDGSCTFDSFEHLSGNMSVEYTGGDQVQGTYEIVTGDPTLSISDSRFDNADDTTPTRTRAVLAFAYEFTYDANAAVVESDRREVDVYD